MEHDPFTTHTFKKKRTDVIRQKRKSLLMILVFVLLSVALGLAILYGRNRMIRKVINEDEQDKFAADSLSENPWLSMRLPNDIVPSTYDLALNVSMEKDEYNGFVKINFAVARATKYVILHQVGLNIKKVIIHHKNGTQAKQISNMFSYTPYEFYVIELLEDLHKGGLYVLTIIFTGELRSELSGFYKSYYQEGAKKRKVASTFFSPISARKAFPCFDEPKFKANFTLTLTHDDGYHALANMPPTWQSYTNGTVTTFFQTSIKMSTYILCWVISDFKSIQSTIKSNVKLRAWAPLNNLIGMKYGLASSQRLLTFYEEYFKIKFPLTKLDIVSVPNFGPGAMENWGLITYRSTKILYDSTHTNEEKKQSLFSIIAHETVHQWFGNLATMKFWTDAWLKEGFANYIGIYGANQLEPSTELLKSSIIQYTLPGFEIDSYSTSHPISTQANTPDEIREIFDSITYNKGHCMVQMLHEYLGSDFQKGLQRYLATYSYKNADQDDLWTELSLASNKDVKSVMDTWTLQLGHPVITASRINNTHIIVKQERFTLDPPGIDPPPSPFNYLWQVPISYSNLKDGAVKTYLLTNTSDVISVPEDHILNPKHRMFYRVNYQGKMLDMVKRKLEQDDSMLTSQDKVGLIHNQFKFAAANLSEIKHALDMTKYMTREKDFYPWTVTIDELSSVLAFTDERKHKDHLIRYIRNITYDITKQIGWIKMTTVNEIKLQGKLLALACSLDVPSVVNQAKAYYSNWMAGKTMDTDPNLYSMIRACGILQGGEPEWNFALHRYMKGGLEKGSILTNLAATKNETLIKRLLSYTRNSSIISSQDTPYVIGDIASNSEIGRNLAWSHVKTHWTSLFNIFNRELFLLGKLISSVVGAFSSEKDLQDIEQFFQAQGDIGSGTQAYHQSMVKIKSAIHWKKINAKKVIDWLRENTFKLSVN